MNDVDERAQRLAQARIASIEAEKAAAKARQEYATAWTEYQAVAPVQTLKERKPKMARETQTILVCDGCSTKLVEAKGTSRVTVDEFEGKLRKLDFCVECTKKLPEGVERKRPGARPKKK